MDKKTTTILAAGIVLTLIAFLINIYLAGIVLIVFIAIVMSLLIMQDTTFLPQLDVRLREDAKAVVVTNNGNSPALNIHVALVPMDIEYDIPSLAVDASHEYPFSSMVTEVKAVITFSSGNGRSFSESRKLSASGEYDPFKPVVPIFGWK